MKTVRCFLAINLELNTAQKIAELQQEMIQEAREYKTQIRWVPPQNMHVTVRFLGNITEPMIQAIKDHLEVTTRNAAPFQMQTGAVRTFNAESDTDSPRILYYEMNDPDGDLNRLVTQVHEILVNTGFKELEKPFVPHVTLARLENAEQSEIQQLTENFSTPLDCVSTVRTLVCYQSDLKKSGVDYQLLWKLPLKKRPPAAKAHPQSQETESELTEAQEEPIYSTEAPDDTQNDTQNGTQNSSAAHIDSNSDSEPPTKPENDNTIGSDSPEQGDQE